MAKVEDVYRVADELRARKERVSIRSVGARLKRNGGVAGSNRPLGDQIIDWKASREYSPIIELAGMPDAVSTKLAKAGVELWQAAQAEAAAMLVRDRKRMDEAIQAETALRDEALALLDARDAEIRHLRDQIGWYAGELERLEGKFATSEARGFWRRVVREIWEILPEREAMHVNDIVERIGPDLVEEAGKFRQVWDVDTVRGAIDERRYKRRMFFWEGGGRYRRRRPEDAAA
jgi:hypothetical protein